MPERGYIIPIGGAEDRSPESIVLQRFVEICGGDGCHIAIIPTASQLKETGPAYQRAFAELGADQPKSLPFTERKDADNEEWLGVLERADGVFFTGGNQLRLSTVLGGTRVNELLRQRNLEGLHVAGTSAGAAILSEHMIAYGKEGSTPRGEAVALAPGLGVLDQVIIDQHFSQRDRLGRLLTALSYNPRLIGVGVDENTAAVIGPDGKVEAIGEGSITIVDASELEFSSADLVGPDQPVSLFNLRLHILAHGASYNLAERRAWIDANPDIEAN